MFGAICGDILGSGYEFEEIKYDDISLIRLINDNDVATDDTAMTVAVADWLMNDITGVTDEEELKLRLAKRFVEYAFKKFDAKKLGFGFNFWQWLCKGNLINEYTPYGSYGNGAGMRVSPVGWYFDTMEETLRFAKISADVSHNHPEGEKGAMTIAAAVFMARTGKNKQEIKQYLFERFGYHQLNLTAEELRAECKWSAVCQDTVPMAVVAFLESDDYISALKLAISYGSDSDTISAMTGAIAEAYYKHIPENILTHCRSRLPSEVLKTCDEFNFKMSIR